MTQPVERIAGASLHDAGRAEPGVGEKAALKAEYEHEHQTDHEGRNGVQDDERAGGETVAHAVFPVAADKSS